MSFYKYKSIDDYPVYKTKFTKYPKNFSNSSKLKFIYIDKSSVDMYIGYLSMYLWYDDWFISDFSSSPPYDDVKFFNFWLWNRNSENLYKIEIPINKKNNRFYESIRYRNRKIASKIEKVSLYSSAVCAIYKKG